MYKYIKRHRLKIKEILVKSFGEECVCCGYSRCLRALEFHHLDPNKKEFNISSYGVMKYSDIFDECGKCIMVCSNCHKEIHGGLVPKVNLKKTFDRTLAESMIENRNKYKTCPTCECEFLGNRKYCSDSCVEISKKERQKVDWSKVDLYDMIKVKKLSFVAMGEILGVSDNAVRKRARKEGLPYKKKDRI